MSKNKKKKKYVFIVVVQKKNVVYGRMTTVVLDAHRGRK